MTYANFVEDLKYRLMEYNDSVKSEGESRYPKRQREIWAPSGRCQAITQSTFGYDHEDALRLLEEFGYDGAPVSSQKPTPPGAGLKTAMDISFLPKKTSCGWVYSSASIFTPFCIGF